MSISNFKIKEGLDLDGLVLTNSNGTLYADGSAVGTTYIDSVSTDFDVTNGLLGLSQNSTIATQTYVDTAVSNLVDGAPALLDTLNEIAAAINDDENYFTTISTQISGKQDTLTASTGITIDGSNNISVKVNGIAPEGYNAVETDAVTGDLIVLNTVVPGTTDDLTEGINNQYFTQSRARDAFSDGDGIDLTSGTISVKTSLSGGLGFEGVKLVVDRTQTDTWYDANGVAATAETNANNYTDTALNDYTTTANLDTTIDGYGYLKSADLSGYATETYVDTAVGNIDLSSKQNVLTAGNGIDITNDTISLDSDVIVTSVALTDATTGVSAGSDVLGNATNTTYAMGSAQTVYTFTTGTKTADIFVQIVNASGDTRTSKITAVFNGGSAPIWTEYGIVDSGTAMATTVSFDSYAFKINITGSSTYAVHGVTTFLS